MSGIIEKLLLRNLQEVFGEGDPTRRRAAIEELYTEDCTVLLPIGRFVGRAALDQVAGELRASHPRFRLHATPPAAGCPGWRASGMGLRAGRRAAQLHRTRRHHRPRRKDRCTLCLPRLTASVIMDRR